MRLSKLINMWVYRRTEKPEHYKRVKNPPKTAMDKILRPQDARQQQFNNWCKRNGVYCGSYLPEDHKALLKKGWRDTTNPVGRKNKPDITNYRRKSSGQTVAHHDEKDGALHHYHWYNSASKKRDDYYFDAYGDPCKKGARATHIAPLDKDYEWWKKK